ncbi:MAG: Y4bD/Y4pK family protein [Nitrospira sp.]|nr:Y4bD/Y4pK family protein [Nitrospira sp.]
MGERYNRYGKRLLLRVDDRTICSVPPQWTDLVAPDVEIVMGKGRALLRVADLMELARLVGRLNKGAAQRSSPDAT